VKDLGLWILDFGSWILDPGLGGRRRLGSTAAAPRGGRRRRRACGCRAGLTALFLVALLPGCHPKPPPEPEAVRDVVQRGPLKLVVTAAPPKVQVGDPVTITVNLDTPEGYTVTLPAESAFGDLGAKQTDAYDARPAATGVAWQRTFAFEPIASGPLEIPSLVVKYAHAAPGTQPTTAPATQPVQNELASAALKIEVLSALTAQDNPSSPRDITGTLLPPIPPLKPWQWALIVSAVLVLAAAGLWAYKRIRRRLSRPPPPVLPEIWALRALEALAREDWFTAGQFREYYYRLTEIVRSYIERKFTLAASEMTTEEFLNTLAHDRGALPYDAERLRVFLEACDLVKYAAARPRREDGDAVLGTARAFVHATAAAHAQTSLRVPSGAAA
jgi:hypothetical protein